MIYLFLLKLSLEELELGMNLTPGLNPSVSFKVQVESFLFLLTCQKLDFLISVKKIKTLSLSVLIPSRLNTFPFTSQKPLDPKLGSF